MESNIYLEEYNNNNDETELNTEEYYNDTEEYYADVEDSNNNSNNESNKSNEDLILNTKFEDNLFFDSAEDLKINKYYQSFFTDIVSKTIYKKTLNIFVKKLYNNIHYELKKNKYLKKLYQNKKKEDLGDIDFIYKGGLAIRDVINHNINKEENIGLHLDRTELYISEIYKYFKPSDFDSSIYINYKTINNTKKIENNIRQVIIYGILKTFKEEKTSLEQLNELINNKIHEQIINEIDNIIFIKNLLKYFIINKGYIEVTNIPGKLKAPLISLLGENNIDSIPNSTITKLFEINIERNVGYKFSILQNLSFSKNIINNNFSEMDILKALYTITKDLFNSDELNENEINNIKTLSNILTGFQLSYNSIEINKFGFKGFFDLIRIKIPYKITVRIRPGVYNFFLNDKTKIDIFTVDSFSELLDVSIPKQKDMLRSKLYENKKNITQIVHNNLKTFNLEYYKDELIKMFELTELCPFLLPKYEKRINRVFFLSILLDQINANDSKPNNLDITTNTFNRLIRQGDNNKCKDIFLELNFKKNNINFINRVFISKIFKNTKPISLKLKINKFYEKSYIFKDVNNEDFTLDLNNKKNNYTKLIKDIIYNYISMLSFQDINNKYRNITGENPPARAMGFYRRRKIKQKKANKPSSKKKKQKPMKQSSKKKKPKPKQKPKKQSSKKEKRKKIIIKTKK